MLNTKYDINGSELYSSPKFGSIRCFLVSPFRLTNTDLEMLRNILTSAQSSHADDFPSHRLERVEHCGSAQIHANIILNKSEI